MQHIFDLNNFKKVNRLTISKNEHVQNVKWMKVCSENKNNVFLKCWFKGVILYRSDQTIVLRRHDNNSEYVLQLSKDKLFISDFDEKNNAIKELELFTQDFSEQDDLVILAKEEIQKLKSESDMYKEFTFSLASNEQRLLTGSKAAKNHMHLFELQKDVQVLHIEIADDMVATASFWVDIFEKLREDGVSYITCKDEVLASEFLRAIQRLSIREFKS